MTAMTEITCKCGCGRKKTVRTADVNRGWGLYFSKACKASHQPARTAEKAQPVTKDIRATLEELVRFAIAERDAFYDVATDSLGHPSSQESADELNRIDRIIDQGQAAIAGLQVVGYMDPKDHDVMPKDIAEGCATDPGFAFTVPVYAIAGGDQ